MESFIELVRKYPFPKDSLIMGFSPAEDRFEPYEYGEIFLKQTDQGRIFSQTRELKWRKIDTHIRVVYLGEEAPPEGLDDFSEELSPLRDSSSRFFLWGVRKETQTEWFEQMVPRRFKYPLSTRQYSPGRIVLITRDRIDQAGHVRLSRYHHIEETPGEA